MGWLIVVQQGHLKVGVGRGLFDVGCYVLWEDSGWICVLRRGKSDMAFEEA